MKRSIRGCHKWVTAMVLAMALPMPVRAADRYVATNGTGVGTSWATAFTNIQDALDVASDGETIHLAGHTFRLTNQLDWTASGITVHGGYEALETDPAKLPGTNNPALWPTVIARGSGTTRIIHINGADNSTLESVTVTGGNAYAGGGLRIENSAGVRISGCIVTNNGGNAPSMTLGGGGGIWETGSDVTLSNCVLRANRARGYTGGDHPNNRCFGGAIASYGTMSLRDCVLADNQVTTAYRGPAYGGGIYFSGTRLSLANVLLAANNSAGTTTAGDGLYVAAGTVTLGNCTVADHSGAGVFQAGGTVTVTNSILWDNWTDMSGSVTTNFTLAGRDPLFEYGYYLAAGSPAANAGSDTAANLGLAAYAKNAAGDTYGGAETVNLGWHYTNGFDTEYADVYVATNGDDDVNSGKTAGSAFRTFTKALVTARDGTRIHVAAGTYSAAATGETFPLSVYGIAGLQILGANAADTVLDAGSAADTRVLGLTCAPRSVIANLTLSGGNTHEGGGLRVYNSQNVRVSGCVVSSNAFTLAIRATRQGAGIYAGSSAVTLTNCTIRNNTGINTLNFPETTAFGGGVASDGCLAMRDCTVCENQVTTIDRGKAYGGGIYFSGTRLALTNVLLAANDSAGTTTAGDGIYVVGGTVTLDSCTVADHSGEGLYRAGGTVTISNSILSGNSIDLSGTVTTNYTLVGQDPLFEYGYYLAAESPAANAGSDTATARGLAGYAKNAAGETYGAGEIVNLGWHYMAGFDTEYADLFVAPDGDDEGNSGKTVDSPFQTVTKALATARDGTRIHVAAGTYSAAATGETFPLSVSGISGLQILGAGAEATVLDAGSAGVRVLEFTTSPGTVLEQVTVTGGNAYDGGGLRIENSAGVRISGCIVTNNGGSAPSMAVGGGAGIWETGSEVTLSNCVLRANRASGYGADHPNNRCWGGAIASYGTMSLRDCILVDNQVTTTARGPAYGGGIYFSGTQLSLVNVLLAANNAEGSTTTGDGLYVAAGSVGLVNCTVADHSGEGIVQAAGTVTVTNSILWDNWTDMSGSVTTNFTLAGRDPLFEYGYYLAAGSPAANAGSDTAANLGLAAYTKNAAGDTYGGAETVNLGWHYTNGFDTEYADIYVATDGDDDVNSGKTVDSAFRTFTKALVTARDGTRIHVAAGTYSAAATGETFPLSVYGIAGLRILGANAADTVLDAGSVTGTRVLEMTCLPRGVIKGLTLTGGKQYGGGALRAENSRLLLFECAITNNGRTSSGYLDSGGAGIWETSSDVTLSNCLVRANTGGNTTSHPNGLANGGGIASYGRLTVRDSRILDNHINGLRGNGRGGGVYFNGNRLEFKNVLIAVNSATKTGDGLQGGAGLYVAAGAAEMMSTTLADNDGEGVRRVSGTVSVTNSILWGNENDIEGTVTLGWSNVEDGDSLGVDACISADPLFASPAAGDFRLQKDSPCINAGTIQDWMAEATDLDGKPRVSMGEVDMGCYEVQAPVGTLILIR